MFVPLHVISFHAYSCSSDVLDIDYKTKGVEREEGIDLAVVRSF